MKIETKKGFTFFEIMIVVVIIALLVALAIPAFQKFRQTSQKKTMINNYVKAIDKVADETYISPLTTATTQLTAIASAVFASITF